MIKHILRPPIILWEIFFAWKENIYPAQNSPYGLLRIGIHPFRGEPVTLSDDTQIGPGDLVIELHIANLLLIKGKVGDVEVASDLQLLPLFREELRNLCKLVQDGKLDPKIKAIWGVTMMGPGVRRLGFTLHHIQKGRNSTFLKVWMSFLKWIFSPPQVNTRSKRNRQPMEYWMSIDELIEKYGA